MIGNEVKLTNMNKILEANVLKTFRFLVTDFGMSQPLIKEAGSLIVVAYLGNTVGFEVELDVREQQIYMLVVHLNNGRLPKGYYREADRTVRIHLEKLLKFYYGMDVPNQNAGETPEGQMNHYAKLLRKYGSQLLEQGERLFEHPPL